MWNTRMCLGLVMILCLSSTGCFNETVKTSDHDIKQMQYAEVVELMNNPGSKKQGIAGVFSDSDKTARTLVLDVRLPAAYAEGHIPGAVNIPLAEVVENDPRLIADHIIVYASGWTDYLAPAGVKKLLALKYTNVYLFKGGMEVWQDSGGAIATGASP